MAVAQTPAFSSSRILPSPRSWGQRMAVAQTPVPAGQPCPSAGRQSPPAGRRVGPSTHVRRARDASAPESCARARRMRFVGRRRAHAHNGLAGFGRNRGRAWSHASAAFPAGIPAAPRPRGRPAGRRDHSQRHRKRGVILRRARRRAGRRAGIRQARRPRDPRRPDGAAHRRRSWHGLPSSRPADTSRFAAAPARLVSDSTSTPKTLGVVFIYCRWASKT